MDNWIKPLSNSNIAKILEIKYLKNKIKNKESEIVKCKFSLLYFSSTKHHPVTYLLSKNLRSLTILQYCVSSVCFVCTKWEY